MSWNPVSRDREAGWILSESPVFRCIILNGMNGHQVKREGKREPFLCDFQSVTCISDNRSGLFFYHKTAAGCGLYRKKHGKQGTRGDSACVYGVSVL